MQLLLAFGAALAWLAFLGLCARVLFWALFDRTLEAKRRRAALYALIALAVALVLLAARFMMSFG